MERARATGEVVFATACARVQGIGALELVAGARHEEAAAAFVSGERAFPIGPPHLELAACGSVATIEASGPGRFARARAEASDLFARVLPDPAAPGIARARVAGGFSFGDRCGWPSFPALFFFLPERALVHAAGGTWLTVAARVAPGEQARAVAARLGALLDGSTIERAPTEVIPRFASVARGDPGAFCARVLEASRAIAAGRFEKVVLARDVRASASAPIPPLAVAARLRACEPGCWTLFLHPPSAGSLVGASPERLVLRRGACAATVALAGTAPRGDSEASDRAIAHDLLESPKERAEHAAVVRAISSALGAGARVDRPRILRLARVQHLATRMSVRLGEAPPHILELAERLHPTPAVAGAPRRPALEFIGEEEALARGFYTGAVGFFDACGDGDLAVAIRSAWLEGPSARLFAGAGIVAGSDPRREWEETERKLETMERALGMA